MIVIPPCIPISYDVDDPQFLDLLGSRAMGSIYAQWSFGPSGIVLSGKASMPVFSRDSAATRCVGVGQIETVASNVLRMDHDPVTGEYLGALFEGPKTNTLFRSEEFGDSYWSKSRVSAIAGIAAPDSTFNACKLAETAETGTHNLARSDAYTSAAIYTTTAWMKAGERTYGAIARITSHGVVVNLLTGEVTSFGGASGHATAHIDGWYRVVMTHNNSDAVGNINVYAMSGPSFAADRSYEGVPGSGIYVFGLQVEIGALSSYIRTAGAAATRQGDTMIVNDMSWFNPEGGIFLAKVRAYPGSAPPASTGRRVFRMGNAASLISLETSSADNLVRAYVGPVAQVRTINGTMSQTQWEYLAVMYSTTGGSYFARRIGNGSVQITDNIGNYNGVAHTSMLIGDGLNGHLSDFGIRYMPGQFNATDVANLLAAMP